MTRMLHVPNTDLSLAPLAGTSTQGVRPAVSDATGGSRGRHLPGIHGLRAAAALGIVFFHVHLVPYPALQVPKLLDLNLGVCVHLFFVISAFSLFHAHAREAGLRTGWIRDYALKRFFRIAPLFYVILLTNPMLDPLTIKRFLLNALFLFNFFPGHHYSSVWAGWTIGVEMPIYAILPLAMIFITSPARAAALTAASFGLSLGARAAFAGLGDYAYMSLAGNAMFFALGALVFQVAKDRKRLSIPLIGALATLGLIVLAALPWRPASEGPHFDTLLWGGPLALVCLWQAVSPSRLMSSPAMQWIGERSFSVYLLHPIVVVVLSRTGVYATIYSLTAAVGSWAYIPCVLLTIAIVLACAACTYRLIEAPGQKIGASLIRALRLRDAASAGEPLRRDKMCRS
jgi:peptidoglycan/LPS O-acetylase OafA/YrhL